MLNPDHYLVILCGGTGPRLWPLSRASFPKQLLKLYNNKSLLDNTIERCKKMASSKNIYITTTKNLQSKIKFPNLLVEPTKQNTTMAALFAITTIASHNPNAVITTMPSDHFIGDINKLESCLKKSFEIAKENKIALIGIKPSFANVSYGYISSTNSHFVEKPKLTKAEELVNSDYYWNTDINTYTPATLLHELSLYSPKYVQRSLKELYKKSPNLNLANSILEKSKKLVLIKGDFAWNDVGEWKTIYQQLPKTKNQHVLINDARFIDINSSGCLLYGQSDKLIGLVGVEGITVIDTPDALLICNTKESYQVRELVKKITKIPNAKKYFL